MSNIFGRSPMIQLNRAGFFINEGGQSVTLSVYWRCVFGIRLWVRGHELMFLYTPPLTVDRKK